MSEALSIWISNLWNQEIWHLILGFLRTSWTLLMVWVFHVLLKIWFSLQETWRIIINLHNHPLLKDYWLLDNRKMNNAKWHSKLLNFRILFQQLEIKALILLPIWRQDMDPQVKCQHWYIMLLNVKIPRSRVNYLDLNNNTSNQTEVMALTCQLVQD